MVERISYALYELKPQRSLNVRTSTSPRHGALLKVEFSDIGAGYSDLHPWPEFGDLSLHEQLKRLKSEPTSLGNISLFHAERDARARKNGETLLTGASEIKNNALVPFDVSDVRLSELRELGFKTLKLKAGHDLPEEKKFVNRILAEKTFRLRLDFNGNLNWNQFEAFFQDLRVHGLDYVEDPFPYDERIWREGRKLAPLALDFESEKIFWSSRFPPTCDALVLKPSRLPMSDVSLAIDRWALPFTVTSSMDHTVGILHAVAWAAELKTQYPTLNLDSGFLTLDLFEPDAFSSTLPIHGPQILVPDEPGIGMTSQLQSLPWVEL